MAPISADKRENTASLMTNPSTQASDRNNGELYLYKGSYHMVLVDNLNGGKKYIFDNSGKKMYLEDIAIFQMQDETMAKRKAAQNNMFNFLGNQINDFASWKKEYEQKAAKWAAKAELNKSIYEASQEVVKTAENDLRPYYRKYNNYNAKSILSDNVLSTKDQKEVYKLVLKEDNAKHAGNTAFSLWLHEVSVVNEYKESASFAKFCGSQVAKMLNNCLKQSC